MPIFLAIAGLIALLCFAAMCIYVIIALKESRVFMRKAVVSLEDTVKAINRIESNVEKTLSTANTTLEHTSNTVIRIDNQFESLETGIDYFNSVAKRVNDLELILQRKIEGPLMQAASVVSGVAKAFSAISSSLSSGKNK
ncbi:MAG: DUF948 domain-containing protein [Ignavibacteriae bacterium]|nr:DUF948 domain-containing protein [Ignavibacteriota bacterium]